jgi:hypothetical protein
MGHRKNRGGWLYLLTRKLAAGSGSSQNRPKIHRKRPLAPKRGAQSYALEEIDDEHDDQDGAEEAGRTITPGTAMPPSRQRTEQGKNENDDDYGF